MELSWPFHLDGAGRAASAGYPEHVRQMIEQVLFTSPGERVNRPDFGCGLMRLVFAADSIELTATLRYSIQSALDRWLSGIVSVELVTVAVDDASLIVTVQYILLSSGSRQIARFERMQGDLSGGIDGTRSIL